MKKVLKTIGKPVVLITTIITALAVILAKIFITKDNINDEE